MITVIEWAGAVIATAAFFAACLCTRRPCHRPESHRAPTGCPGCTACRPSKADRAAEAQDFALWWENDPTVTPGRKS